jgi:hypothetical protein
MSTMRTRLSRTTLRQLRRDCDCHDGTYLCRREGHITRQPRGCCRKLHTRRSALPASDCLGTHPACRTSVARPRDNTCQRRVVKDKQRRRLGQGTDPNPNLLKCRSEWRARCTNSDSESPSCVSGYIIFLFTTYTASGLSTTHRSDSNRKPDSREN